MTGVKKALALSAVMLFLAGCSGGDGLAAQKDALNDAWQEVAPANKENLCFLYTDHKDIGWPAAQSNVDADLHISEEAYDEWVAETC